MIFLNKRKTILKNFIPKGKSPNLPLLNFPAKFRTEKKSQMDNFTIMGLPFRDSYKIYKFSNI